MADKIHVTSLTVKVDPPKLGQAIHMLNQESGTTVHFKRKSDSKIIVIYESITVNEISQFIEQTRNIDGVNTVEMIFHQAISANTIKREVAEQKNLEMMALSAT